MLNIWYAHDLPYGPRPIWARAHMGQGPYGPRAPGPRALPCWANTSPKNAPWKKESKLCFFVFFGKQKRCAASVRSFWRRYRAEISAMCQKTKVSVFEKKTYTHLYVLFWGAHVLSGSDFLNAVSYFWGPFGFSDATFLFFWPGKSESEFLMTTCSYTKNGCTVNMHKICSCTGHSNQAN